MLESTLDTTPNNFRNISKKFKKRLITWLLLGHFKCVSILNNDNIIFSKELAERGYRQTSVPHPLIICQVVNVRLLSEKWKRL